MIRRLINGSLCSGKSYADTQRIIQETGLEKEIHVVEGGARIVSGNGKNLSVKKITLEILEILYKALKEESGKYAICSDGQWVYDWTEAKDGDITGFWLEATDENEVKRMYTVFDNNPNFVDLNLNKYSHWEYEHGALMIATDKHASKYHGVEYLQTYYGIQVENTACVGDMDNDLGMFERSGVRVAMGNAVQLLKDRADFIAPSVDEYGVVSAIKYIINII